MAEMYVRGSDGVLERAKLIRCKDEEKELQDLLQRNPALLAGEQMNPDEPRRWLLVKREMSIPDPSTGSDRWNIDFLYIDQDATLTFVECKRHGDTRSRREVIAQVIDYIANSSRLWNKDQLIDAASAQAMADKCTLASRVEQLGASDFSTVESLMQAAIDKLGNHDVRIVLFMEAAPPELKTIVEFMNKEMSTVEVLLVEAKMYDVNGVTVVTPCLWGYTDAVRARKNALAALEGGRIKWNADSFLADLDKRVVDTAQNRAVRELYGTLPAMGYQFRFGTGTATGSFNARLSSHSDLAVLTVRSDGTLMVNFGSFAAPEYTELREALAGAVAAAGLPVPVDYAKRYVNYRAESWTPNIGPLIKSLAALDHKQAA